jgi:hypothetical protein
LLEPGAENPETSQVQTSLGRVALDITSATRSAIRPALVSKGFQTLASSQKRIKCRRAGQPVASVVICAKYAHKKAPRRTSGEGLLQHREQEWCLLEQAQYALLALVGLREHRG